MWDVRGRRRYYYRSRMVDGQSRRIYVGSGPKADLAAAEDAERAARRQRAAQVHRGAEALDQVLEGLDANTALLTQSTLLAAGYYQHDRGPWRRRHARREKNQPPAELPSPVATTS